MAPLRCKFCVSLALEDVRSIVGHRHHNSLQELKSCADSQLCDICLLFWTALRQEYSAEKIKEFLTGPETAKDTAIMLTGLIDDMGSFLWQGYDRSSPGSIILVEIGETKYGGADIYVFAHPGSFAARYLAGRNSTTSPDPNSCIYMARDWLAHCNRYHRHCGGSKPMPMPTRVIDIGDPLTTAEPKLCITEGRCGRYVALSYSWGENVRHKIKLKKATLEPFKVAIPEASMTLAHRETLQIARKLGYRYIWIDAFGIVQDDKDDWASESVKIAAVYGNAELTIVAGRSDNSLNGFVEHTFKPILPPSSLPYSRPNTENEEGSLCFLSLKRSIYPGPVEERAWCFQESMLSRRAIIYGEEQMGFKCRERTFQEDGRHSFNSWGAKGFYDLSTDSLVDKRITREVVLERWYHLTFLYSLRDVFDPTDNFATISGVALRFQQALCCRFLAGLWENDMVRGLLWKSRRLLPKMTQDTGSRSNKPLTKPIAVSGNLKGRPIARAPSWSWLALLGPIVPATERRHMLKFKDSSMIRCRPANPDSETWSPDSWDPSIVKYPFPQCRLEVLGCIREVRCSSITTSEYMQKRKPRWTFQRVRRHTILLEPIEDIAIIEDDRSESCPENQVVAMGLFDLVDGNPQTLSIMCLLGDEGLMLERQSDGTFCRLGVFIAENDAWCYTGKDDRLVLV